MLVLAWHIQRGPRWDPTLDRILMHNFARVQTTEGFGFWGVGCGVMQWSGYSGCRWAPGPRDSCIRRPEFRRSEKE